MNYYNTIKEALEKEECILLTTLDEYNEMYSVTKNKHVIRFRFIATCGHENDVAYTNFITRKTGLLCKKCTKNKVKKSLKEKQQSNLNMTSLITENNGINTLEKYISDKYIIKKTNEGCGADLAIKEITSENDEWIPLQIKVTNKKSDHNMYSFNDLYMY
jgi:hypothetical protein